MHPFLIGLRPTLHISHRGGAALAPENTLVAFQAAVSRHRTDMLELDVQATRDGALVVAHDEDLARCTDREGPLAALTLAELEAVDAGYRFSPDGGATTPFRGQGVRIPLLREVLRALPQVRINLELKPSATGAEDALAALLRAEDATSRVCVGSESDDVAKRLLGALPEACHFYPRLALTELVLAAKSGLPCPEAPYTVLDMPLFHEGLRLIDEPFLQAMAAMGKWVNVWTVDDPDEMRRLAREGVGGIMTDRPDLLRDVLG